MWIYWGNWFNAVAKQRQTSIKHVTSLRAGSFPRHRGQGWDGGDACNDTPIPTFPHNCGGRSQLTTTLPCFSIPPFNLRVNNLLSANGRRIREVPSGRVLLALRHSNYAAIEEPGMHFALTLDLDRAAFFQRERGTQALPGRVGNLDPTGYAV